MCSGITLTKNETEDVIKVVRYLDNRIMLLKASTRKISTQKGGFLNFLAPLMPVCLPLMKNVPTPLANSVLLI